MQCWFSFKGTFILMTKRWCMGKGEVMEGWCLSLCWQSLKATNQELVAGVLVVFLYVQGLDLGVGDAGTVLVDGEGRSTGETCLPGPGWVRGGIQLMESREITQSGREGSGKQASRGYACESTYRVFFSQVCEWRETGWWEQATNEQQVKQCPNRGR